MYVMNEIYIDKSIIAFQIPILFPEMKIKKVIIVSINSTTKIFKLKDKISGFITIGPYNNVYKIIGKPSAKHISKILLPKAFEIASL